MKATLFLFLVLLLSLVCFIGNVSAQDFFQLNGTVDFVNKTLRVGFEPQGNPIELLITLESTSKFILTTKLQHIKLGALDIFANVYTSGHVYYGENKVIDRIKFDVNAKNILINHLPVEDLFIDGEINGYTLRIHEFKGFNVFSVGYIDLRRPYNIEILSRLRPFSLLDLAKTFENENPNIAGDLEGIIRLEGVLSFLQLKANLAVYNGMLEGVPFKEAVINFAGAYPIVRFTNSKILSEDDSLLDLSGFLDLSKLSNLESPFHNFKLEPTGNQVRIADWNLMKEDISSKEFSFKKDIDESFSVSFESYVRDETKYRDYEQDSFELKYKLDDKRSINMKLKNNEGILGVERKIEF